MRSWAQNPHSQNPKTLPPPPVQAGPILRDFAARWKDALEDMHREVAKHFAHAACGRDVLQVGVCVRGEGPFGVQG